MAEGKNNKEEKFDFTSDGEDVRYISLDQAVLQARQQAQEDGERYRVRLGWEEIVWSEIRSEEREDTFRIVLQFRRPGRGISESQTGEEEFFFDQAGALVFRQVLAWPESLALQEESNPTIANYPSNVEEPQLEHVERINISFISAIKLGFQGYFNFRGRSTRAEFWWWNLFVFLGQILAAIADSISGIGALTALFYIAIIIPGFAVGARRLHDINKSGWWSLLILLWWLVIPVIVLLFWFTRPSSDKNHRLA